MNANYRERIKQLSCLLERGGVVFFGGAGVSTESGIPDFRSVDGLYYQQYDYPPEEMISHSFFERKTEEFYRFYREKMLFPKAEPNDCHRALATLEMDGKLNAVVTQNIDGLHQRAGSKKVFELHGSVWRNYCMRCGAAFSLAQVRESENVPRCSCGGMVKPDVVLYEEGLDDDVVTGAVRAIAQAKTLIVGGTSLVVYPAAGLLRYFRGDNLVVINRTPTQADGGASLLFTEDIGKVFFDVMQETAKPSEE